jgi:hypothetical protein
MMRGIQEHPLIFTAMTVFLVGLSGCGFLPPLEPDGSWPIELAYLVEHADDFAGDPDVAARPVTFQTTITSLDELVGCWGAFVRSPTTLANYSMDIYQFLRYDAETGILTRYCIDNYWTYNVTVQTGDLSLTDEGRIIFEVSRVDRNGINLVLEEQTPETPLNYEVLAAFNDDGELRAAFVTLDGYSPTPAGFADLRELVHDKVDCPD